MPVSDSIRSTCVPSGALTLPSIGVHTGRHAHERQAPRRAEAAAPAAIDLSLGRVERLLAKLGNPHSGCRRSCTSPAPTARARSPPTSRPCWRRRASACTSTPRRISCASTSASSSPAPTARRAPIGEDELVDVLTRTQRVNGGDDITHFEITTAAAFLAFAEHPADVLMLEVGLGGRLDATNVVDRPRSPSSRRSRWTTPTSWATARRRSPPRRPAS